METTQWAEFAGLGFAMAVMAWVIYRLTWMIVKLIWPEASTNRGQEASGERAANDDDGA